MAKEFVIIVDAASDLQEELRARYDIRIVASHITLPDRSEIEFTNRWEAFTRDEFYAELKKNPDGFQTAPGNAAAFKAAFGEAVSAGKGVLAISISTGISGTYSFMQQAKKELLQEQPDAEIEICDSLRFSVGFGILAIHASKLRAAGKSLQETYAEIEAIKNTVHQAGWLDDLSFVAKKGRLTHAKAFFGSIAGVKPIGEFDYNGLTTVIAKARGAKQAYSALLHYMEKTGVDFDKQDILIAQTNRLPQAEEYKRLIEERFHPASVTIVDIFPPCGVNIGPGLMAAYYFGTPISEGLVTERAILDTFLAK